MRGLLWMILAILVGCSTGTAQPRQPAQDQWWVGFLTPSRMEVWVEDVRAVDVRGRSVQGLSPGIASTNAYGDPSDWPQQPGRGAGLDVIGVGLPSEIYIRWQSLVEPQTYEVTLEIPEHMRTLMRQREAMSLYLPEQRLVPRNHVVVGLAPGGIVKVWNSGSGLQPEAVMCVQASVVEVGPSQGQTDGAYAYPLEKLDPATQLFLKNNPIPFESWSCDET